MSLTKQASFINNMGMFGAKPGSGRPSKGSMFQGAMNVGFAGSQIASGENSVGGAIGSVAAGQAAYSGMDKYLTPHIKGGINTLASKASQSTLGKFVSKSPMASKLLGKIPGPLGWVASMGAGMYASGIGSKVGSKFGNKFAPMWKKPQGTLPKGITQEQMDAFRNYLTQGQNIM